MTKKISGKSKTSCADTVVHTRTLLNIIGGGVYNNLFVSVMTELDEAHRAYLCKANQYYHDHIIECIMRKEKGRNKQMALLADVRYHGRSLAQFDRGLVSSLHDSMVATNNPADVVFALARDRIALLKQKAASWKRLHKHYCDMLCIVQDRHRCQLARDANERVLGTMTPGVMQSIANWRRDNQSTEITQCQHDIDSSWYGHACEMA